MLKAVEFQSEAGYCLHIGTLCFSIQHLLGLFLCFAWLSALSFSKDMALAKICKLQCLKGLNNLYQHYILESGSKMPNLRTISSHGMLLFFAMLRCCHLQESSGESVFKKLQQLKTPKELFFTCPSQQASPACSSLSLKLSSTIVFDLQSNTRGITASLRSTARYTVRMHDLTGSWYWKWNNKITPKETGSGACMAHMELLWHPAWLKYLRDPAVG